MVGIVADITAGNCASCIAVALDTHFGGKVDIVVFNAAVMKLQKIGDLSEDYVQRALMGNVQTPIMVIEELLERKSFRPNSRIVNISSEAVRVRRGPGG